LQGQVDEDRHPKTDVTVGCAVAQWLEVARLEDTTRERYGDLVRLYLKPTFGDLAAAKVTAELLKRFYARLRRCRQMCGGRSGSIGNVGYQNVRSSCRMLTGTGL